MMPFEMRWLDDDQEILLVTYPKEWDWKEFFDFWSGEPVELLDSAQHNIKFISDFNDCKVKAKHITMLPKVGQLPIMHHPNLGDSYGFGATGLEAQTIRIFANVFKTMKVVDSLEDALTQIEQNQ